MELNTGLTNIKKESDTHSMMEENVVRIKTEIHCAVENMPDVAEPQFGVVSRELKCEQRTGNLEYFNNTDQCNQFNESGPSVIVKMENHVGSDEPDSADASSLDSVEATALHNVEVCLAEESTAKNMTKSDYSGAQLQETIKQMKLELLQESGINISNLENADVNSQESNATLNTDVINKSTTDDPTKIYQTHRNVGVGYGAFQLNSITGDELSLEQEAYGLLKAKKSGYYDLNSQRYCCPKCTNTYKTKSYLSAHLKVHASIEKRADGFRRGKVTRLKNRKKKLRLDIEMEFQVHRKQSSNDDDSDGDGYKCTCGKTFQRRTRLETCLRSHDTNEYTNYYVSCQTCNKTFGDKSELVTHRRRYHSRKKFPCKFCPTDYNTRKELFEHLQIHQKVQLMEYKVISEVVNGKQELGCFICPKMCNELAELKSHVLDDHEEPYICPRCSGTFTKIIDFANHTKAWHPEVKGKSVLDVLEAFSILMKAWKCEECDLQFHEAEKLAMHNLEKHSPELNPEQQFQCADCHRVFVSQKGLTSHRRVHHSNETEQSVKQDDGVMCLECRKMCKDTAALTSHMRLHSPDRKYPCKFCDFRFATPEKRKAHAEIHTGEMRFVCFICEYQCSSENRLRQHKMSDKHANMKEYLLSGKPLPVYSRDGYAPKTKKKKKKEKHKEVKTSSSSESEVDCDICGESFSNETAMLEHKQTHPFIEFPNDEKSTRIFFK